MAFNVAAEDQTFYYKKVFSDSCQNLKRNVEKKLKDSNTMKSSLHNPHYRTILCKMCISRYLLLSTYRKLFHDDDDDEQLSGQTITTSPNFQLKTLTRLQELVSSEAFFRQHSSGDISFLLHLGQYSLRILMYLLKMALAFMLKEGVW